MKRKTILITVSVLLFISLLFSFASGQELTKEQKEDSVTLLENSCNHETNVCHQTYQICNLNKETINLGDEKSFNIMFQDPTARKDYAIRNKVASEQIDIGGNKVENLIISTESNKTGKVIDEIIYGIKTYHIEKCTNTTGKDVKCTTNNLVENNVVNSTTYKEGTVKYWEESDLDKIIIQPNDCKKIDITAKVSGKVDLVIKLNDYLATRYAWWNPSQDGDNFNRADSSTVGYDWTKIGVEFEADPSITNNAMLMDGNGEDGEARMQHSLTYISDGTIRARIKVNSLNGEDYMYIKEGSTAIGRLGFVGSDIKYYAGSPTGWVTVLSSVSSDTWYNISFRNFSFDGNTFIIGVNGEVKTGNVSFLNSADTVDTVGFEVGHYNYDLYVDEVYIGTYQTDGNGTNVSNLMNLTVTNTTSIIYWTTFNEVNSTVCYGIGSYNTCIGNSDLNLTHLTPLNGLTPDSTYLYYAQSCVATPTVNCSTDYRNFTTLPSILQYNGINAPIISNLENSSTYKQSTQVSWNLDNSGNASICYGTSSYDTCQYNSSLSTSQTFKITGLTGLTDYIYEVTSCCPAENGGNCTTENSSFRTAEYTPYTFHLNYSVSDFGYLPPHVLCYALNDGEACFNENGIGSTSSYSSTPYKLNLNYSITNYSSRPSDVICFVLKGGNICFDKNGITTI